MNRLYFVITSSLQNQKDVIRLCKSVDICSNIHLFFVNQSKENNIQDIYEFKYCKINEFNTNGIIPLSVARNIALEYMYNTPFLLVEEAIVMFIDDDAWFPKETIDMLLKTEIKSMCLRTIDPETNKSFNGLSYTEGEVKGWHLIHDICSICLVVPYKNICETKEYFHEYLGVGNEISQGEESLFIYELHNKGVRIFYNSHYIFHPYKISNNIKNYYSLSYFWAWGLTHVSSIFFIPCVKYLVKYTVALCLTFKSRRYPRIFINVWKGAIDGMRNKKNISRRSL